MTMSHRMKYSLEKKKIILNEYDYGNHTTKQIAEKYQMPLSTVLYFIRNRSKYEQRNNHHQDDQDDQDNIGVKRKRLDIDSICSSDDDDQNHHQQQQQQQPRIRKISNDMKSMIIKAWEERDQGGNDNGGGGVGSTMRKIAEHFGVSTRSVSRCLAYQRRRNDLIASNQDDNSVDHQNIDDNEFDLDDVDDDDDDLLVIQSNSNVTDKQSSLVDDHHSSTMISNLDHQNDENETINRQWSSIKRSKSTIDPCDQKLDDELINSINEIFDHLKKLRYISKRLKSPLNRMVLKFSETILQQANSYVCQSNDNHDDTFESK
ncbi:uncharacterized protein LOC113792391 [Dermatophagoides pteronyssinus]|uniref:uncharacterized protein LOC113792391 n=1 Tax=Dermatophagoides pteronyssinus TaxID=6956 RepID=UPI003F6735AA